MLPYVRPVSTISQTTGRNFTKLVDDVVEATDELIMF